MNALSFNQTTIQPVDRADNQTWITASDLAAALGYARADSVSRIFDRNQDEFTDAMSLTVNLTVNGINNSLRQKDVRIFSLRGCYAIAFFAKTEVAKQFRHWVLDLLEQQSKQLPQMTEDQLMHWKWHVKHYAGKIGRDQVAMIQFLIRRWVEQKGIQSQTAYYTFNQYMRVSGTDQVKRSDFNKAMTWLHHKTGNINYGAQDAKPLKTPKALPAPKPQHCLSDKEWQHFQRIMYCFEHLNVLVHNLHRPLSLLNYEFSADLHDYRQAIKGHCSQLQHLREM